MNSATMSLAHIERIKNELETVGISRYGRMKFPVKYLARAIHPNEYIRAAILGRTREAKGVAGYIESILIATDKRILFIKHQPLYTTMDEISYQVVSGIEVSTAALFASVTLFTKVANYTLLFVNLKKAQQFADCIEGRALTDTVISPVSEVAASTTKQLEDFLNSHEIGVLSSIDRKGEVSGAAIYYIAYAGAVYFMTKTSSRKASNLFNNRQAALTITDETKLQTAQLQGYVESETKESVKQKVSHALIKPHGKHHLPPMATFDDTLVVFKFVITNFSFSDYGQS